MIEYLRGTPLELPTVVDSATEPTNAAFGTLTPSFQRGELLLTNKSGQAYRLVWDEGAESDDRTRPLPAGVWDLLTYRIVRTQDGKTWHLSASGQSIKKIKVKAGENRVVEIEPAIRLGSRLHRGQAQMSIKGDSGAGLSIYRSGKRIPIGYRILNKSGDVLASGDMRYG